MYQLDEKTIYDRFTGICYTRDMKYPIAMTLEEAEKAGETWPVVYVGSVHSAGDSAGLTFERDAAVRLWYLLSNNSVPLPQR